MTPVAEQEKLKIDINIEEDTGQSMDMQWEVETEPAPEPAPQPEIVTVTQETHYENPYTGQYDRTARYSYNKHLFTWLFSFFLGMYGVDRFVRGQIGLGLVKLLSGGGLGIWYLADFIIAAYKSYAAEFSDTEELLFDGFGRYLY